MVNSTIYDTGEVKRNVVRLVSDRAFPLWSGVMMMALVLCGYGGYVWDSGENGPAWQIYGSVRAEAQVVPYRGGGGQHIFQKISERSGEVIAEYGFVNFNDDVLQVAVSLSQQELADYRRDYGYTRGDLDALLTWQRKTLDESFQNAVKNSWSQTQLDKAAADIKAEYRRKHRELLAARGFRFLSANLMAPDIPAIVRRNVSLMHSLAMAVNQVAAARDYDSDAIVGAALALVQTAIRYDNIPLEQNGRSTGGVTPPLLALAEGRGDCDSKTALLAAILLNWDRIRLVGVGVPNHYLLGVLRNPGKGEAFIDFEGLRYVLVEPAGPGWLPPGRIAQSTIDLLNAGNGVNIEPLTVN